MLSFEQVLGGHLYLEPQDFNLQLAVGSLMRSPILEVRSYDCQQLALNVAFSSSFHQKYQVFSDDSQFLLNTILPFCN
ncbi:hypothetical protein VB620_11100 [Nodularia harveyana UHCC-0300]|uniref:Uncharacterized protein n=1 Tax=Nodularia harveyana UHCC-0300 TaxID=2974287 RepID=A0ABU5UED6_9CYAN|nr:hypothetical protein [Nodularia harveyana]MEA5581884.1 hypothetical protein [Nodularia harveyana UHCC-0300]